MQRSLMQSLLKWKEQPQRKPVLIDGVRQTGKTFLLQELLGKTFKNVIRIDFLESPAYKSAFDGSLTPNDIINNIELISNRSFNVKTDLLILDEIGECERALTSLKYFAEKEPTAYVAASGSNIGLLNTFPVGKVEQYKLRPLSFQEFIHASNEKSLITAYDSQTQSTAVHEQLMNRLTDYFFTGGMPEAVQTWYDNKDTGLIERIAKVNKIHENLIEGYQRDFGKYAGKVDAQLIEAVFSSIPSQLSLLIDDSVKRFKFKDVYQRKTRYSDFETAIHWLIRCRLSLPNYPIEGTPKAPLAAYRKENKVKLFLFDVGLLNYMLRTNYQSIKEQKQEYKGYIAENFVQQELAAQGIEPSYSWHDARAEIEFLLTDDAENIIPLEVKSGRRTRAKSLASYKQKCAPKLTVKLTATQGSEMTEKTDLVVPLYYTHYLTKIINAH